MKYRQLSVIMLIFFLMIGLAVSQDEDKKKPKLGWNNEGVANLNFTQNQFDNWSQGGEDSWSWQLDVNTKFAYNREKYKWDNALKVSYGETKVGDDDAKKAADDIKLESVYTYKLKIHINPYVAVTGQTQFTDGYDYSKDPKVRVSGFMDPAYFTQSAGIGYSIDDQFKTRLGAAIKETYTRTDTAALIYADGDDFRVEYGAESVTDFA